MNINSEKEILDQLIGWRDIMNKKITLERSRLSILQEIEQEDRRGRIESVIVRWCYKVWTMFKNECDYLKKYQGLFGLGYCAFRFPYHPVIPSRKQFKYEVDFLIHSQMECYHPGKASIQSYITDLINVLISRYRTLGLLTKEELAMDETTLRESIISSKYTNPPESLHIV